MSKGSPAVQPFDSEKKLHMRLDINKVSTVGDVALGDLVTVTVQGKVTSMRGPEESLYTDGNGKDKANTYPGCLEVQVAKISIAPKGAFSAMEEDED